MKTWITVYVGLGGNIGDSHVLLTAALRALGECPQIRNLRTSSFYETEPVSSIRQRHFLNAVCAFETLLSADDLFQFMETIEKKLGKVPKGKDEPRPIDLDLLFYGSQLINTQRLKVPHPHWKERSFVLIPLRELRKKNIP